MHLVSRYGGEYAQRVDLMKKLYRSEWLNAENDGWTPIMMAYNVGGGNNECARFLLTKGANLNCKSNSVKCVFLCAF